MTPAFPSPQARATDPATSRAAALDTAPRSPRHRVVAAKTLAAHPEGLTDFQLADLTGLQQTSVGKRRGELMAAGYVEEAGIKRSAPSGSMATVWRLTEAGKAWVGTVDESPALRLVEAPEPQERHEEATKTAEAESGPRSARSGKRGIHPAQFSTYLVPVIVDEVIEHWTRDLPQLALDPFAGLGHRFAEMCQRLNLRPYGVEIEPGYFEAGAMNSCVMLGDSTRLTDMFDPGSFGAIITSPTYPNGMNDDFRAGKGKARKLDADGNRKKHHYNTYPDRLREYLGDDYQLAENSTARHNIRKGTKSLGRWQSLHELVLDGARVVLADGGLFVLNVKDVYAKGELAFATAGWFVDAMAARGFELLSWKMVPARGLREGANYKLRADFEDVLTFRKVAK